MASSPGTCILKLPSNKIPLKRIQDPHGLLPLKLVCAMVLNVVKRNCFSLSREAFRPLKLGS